MIHQKSKICFNRLLNIFVLVFQIIPFIRILISKETESSQPKNLSLFSFHRGLHPQKLKCWTFGDWTILPCPLLLRLTSNVKS